VLIEAPIDALSLAVCGVPAVALCGCEGLPDWLRMRCAFQTVIAAFDADDPGDEATRVLRLRPVGAKDWNAALLSRGADDLRTWLTQELAQELASVALTTATDTETENTTEALPGPYGQNWGVSGGIADPFAADGDDPPHVVFVRARAAG